VSLLAMPNQDNPSAEIVELKKDVRELLELLRILSSFVLMPPPGTEKEKTALEYEDRLGAMLDKYASHGHLPHHKDALEGEILELPKSQ
jgi:hypothetical protein